jgi:hypothetical protein
MLRYAILAALASSVVLAAPDEPKKPTPKFKLAKDTTFVTEPLDAEGYIDYEAALNKQLKGTTTPETNAVVLLMKCFGPKLYGKELHPDFFSGLGIEASPAKGEYYVQHSKYFQTEMTDQDRKAFYELEGRLTRRPWKSTDAPKHAERLSVIEKPLAVVAEASKRQGYFYPIIARKDDGSRKLIGDATLALPIHVRETAHALAFRAMLKVGKGRTDDAFVDALTIHRLGHLVSRGSSHLECITGQGIRRIAHETDLAILEHGNLTAKQALSYRDELLKFSPLVSPSGKTILTERLSFLDMVQAALRDGSDTLPSIDLKGMTPEEVSKALDWELTLRTGNAYYDRIEVAINLPTRRERGMELANIGDEIEEYAGRIGKILEEAPPERQREIKSEKVARIYVGLMSVLYQKTANNSDHAEQAHRNSIIATALAAHFADHKKYPDKLDDLVPKYLAKVPDDIFSGKALIYQKTDAGYLFYSVGVNGKDDGGKLLTDEPRGDDIGVRIPRR